MKGARMRKYLSGGGENLSAIGESDMLSSIPEDRESIVFFVSGVIFRCGKIYCSGGRESHQGWRRR